jgi:protein TonB
MIPRRKGPAVVGQIDPNVPPEKILSGKEVYTTQIDLPNLTSATGSWILHFAQLEENAGLSYRLSGKLSAPTPLRTVDPRYPQALIKEHVEGEVILYAVIRKDGSVDSIQLVRGIDPQLDKNAVEALAQWQFRPAARQGVPTDIEAVVYIPFRYRKPDY